MRLLPRILIAGAMATGLAAVAAPSVLGCSPPFEKPSIRGLGPSPIILLGTIGERVATGRLFHLERAWNGVTTTPIVIAFKEGEPVGDCSYPVTSGQRLIIAPDVANGVLSATLVTLQADPATEDGLRYLRETEALHGAGVVPVVATAAPVASTPSPREPNPIYVVVGLGAGVAMFGVVILIARRLKAREPS